MARLRFMAVALLALALAGNSTQTGRSAGQNSRPTYAGGRADTGSMMIKPTVADERSCVIYSLTDMGYDADLGTWIARTIPEMIEPSSWKGSGGSGVLHYYAPKNVLIVSNSTAVRSVDDFLKKLKTSLPKTSRTKFAANKKSSRRHVVPAEYRAPAPMRAANPIPEASSYPVPAQVKPPKHLFHFIIRYEGEGIIDDNVVKFMKGYIQASKDGSSQVPVQATARGYPMSASPSLPSGSAYAGPAMYSRASSSALQSTGAGSPSVARPVGQPKPAEPQQTGEQKEKTEKVR
ncbi:MAG TPA: hypothetical protein VMG10_16970 [Gemmataceae bacterium]|nr:hypothetical protein [Gemmataceae bacterium]